jgi:uncharacterized protein YkwD
MPVDVVRNVMEYLPPETLSTLRGASTEMQYMVDSYVFKLVETSEFQDPEGRDLKELEYPYQPSEILENWGNNVFTRSAAPPSVEEAAATAARRAEAFDTTLTPDVSYEDNPQAFNEEFQRNLATYAEILESGSVSEELEANLYSYFQGLIRTGRLVNPATNKPLRTGTPLSEVMQRLGNGQARWISPAEVFDPSLTPAASYEDNPQAFNKEFQRNLASYAEILEKGGPGVQGLEAALRSYFQSLIRAGRLVDAATNNPLPNGTPLNQIMQLLRNSQARWISPEEAAATAAAGAETFDAILTPAVSYEDNPQAFNEEFQSALASYAEILERGDPVAQGLEAALRSYFQGLLRAGRLVDAATDNPLPTSTSSSKVMELLRNGQARWIAP